MRIELREMSKDQNSVLRNLMEKYLHDFSEYDGADVDEHGLYGYKYIDFYWVEEGRVPLLVRVDGRIAGFALVRRMSATDESPHYSLAEFFIMHKYRRKGIGTEVARRVFDMFPGRWEVGQDPKHVGSHIFWQRVIGDYTGGNYQQILDEDNEPAQVFDTPER